MDQLERDASLQGDGDHAEQVLHVPAGGHYAIHLREDDKRASGLNGEGPVTIIIQRS